MPKRRRHQIKCLIRLFVPPNPHQQPTQAGLATQSMMLNGGQVSLMPLKPK